MVSSNSWLCNSVCLILSSFHLHLPYRPMSPEIRFVITRLLQRAPLFGIAESTAIEGTDFDLDQVSFVPASGVQRLASC
jgi:hypothetical protein